MDHVSDMFAEEHDVHRLAAFLEGRLEGAERDEMVAHLAQCADCRQTIATFTKAGGLETATPLVPASARVRRFASATWLPIAAVLVVGTAATLTLIQDRALVLPPTPSAPPISSNPVGPSPSVLGPSGDASPAHIRPSTRPNDGASIDPGLFVRRGGAAKTLAGKTFRLVAGEWLDTAYDPLAALPRVDVLGPTEREAALQRLPALRPYAALGDRFVVVFEGRVYRFQPTAP